MKTVTILSAILLLSFSSISTDFSKCIFEFTKEDLRADKIELQCQAFNNNEKFSIKGFSIKFPNRPTIIVKGSQLDLKTMTYIEDLEVSQIVSIFDIKSAYNNGTLISNKDIPSFYIKIVE